MPYPVSKLNDYEEAVVDLHPHPWYFVAPVASLTASIVLGFIVAFMFPDIPLRRFATWAVIVLIVASLLRLGWRYLSWRTTHFVVTTDRVVYETGVFAKSGGDIPLERVNNVATAQTFLQRVINVGDLMIESGGESGQQTFSDILRPQEVKKVLNAQVEANYNRGAGNPDTTPVVGPPQLTIIEQVERLEGIWRRGGVDDEEYEAAKRSLLGPRPSQQPPAGPQGDPNTGAGSSSPS